MTLYEQIAAGEKLNNETRLWHRNAIAQGYKDGLGKTLRWYPSDTEENYYRRGNKRYGVDDVSYAFNSLGYRSREPDPTSPKKKIAFFGCSFTFGTGLPLHESWPVVLVDELNKRLSHDTEVHNFGMPGFGNDTIAMLVPQVLQVLKPDIVVVMYTALSRRTFFPDWTHGAPFLINMEPNPLDTPVYTAYGGYKRTMSDPNDFYHWVRNAKLVEYSCKLFKTPLVWTFVSHHEIHRLERATLEKYVSCDGYLQDANFHGLFKSDLEDLARDGLHSGARENQNVAESLADYFVDNANVLDRLCT